MSIQMATQQFAIEQLMLLLKEYKRSSAAIESMVVANRNKEASIMLEQQKMAIKKMEEGIAICQEKYLSPEKAKKVMMIKKQFKQQMQRRARLASNVQSLTVGQQIKQKEELEQYNHDMQHRLIREKGQSLDQVYNKINDIQIILSETSEMTYKQGEELDLIDNNLATTKFNTIESNSHLKQAQTYQKQNQRRVVWIIVGLIIVGCVIFAIVLCTCSCYSLKYGKCLTKGMHYQLY